MNLPDNIKKAIDQFVALLKNAYGGELISVILYGSAASGEYARRHSNIDLAIVLKNASLGAISKTSRFINKRRFMMINPVFFTVDYIKHSTDVFPIEFTDMKENHAVLYGEDIFKDIEISTENLRFQCEQELKSKIINIKRAYLGAAGKEALKKTLFMAVTSSLYILRNLIRLKGLRPPHRKEEVLSDISREFGVDAAPLNKILSAKAGNISLSRGEITGLFSHLVETLETISSKVDQL